MAFNETIYINAPVENVFEVTTDFNQAMSIMNNVVRIEILTEGSIQVGSRVKEVRKIRGKEAETILIVTEYIPNQKYAVKSVDYGITVEYHYQFNTQESGTFIEFNGIIHTKGLKNALLKPLIEMILKKEDKNHLVQLKNYIESKNMKNNNNY
jgi:hypothetical protein